MSLTGQKSPCWQGWFPLEAIRKKSIALPLPPSGGYLHSLFCVPVFPSSLLLWLEPISCISSSLMWTLVITLDSPVIQDTLPFYESAFSAVDAGDLGSFLEARRSPGGRNGNVPQCSCQENPMDRGAWRAIVHMVAKSQTRLSTYPHTHPSIQLIMMPFASPCPRVCCAQSFQSCPTLCKPWTVACQGPLSMEFSRQEYCSGLPLCSLEGLPDPGVKHRPPALQTDSLPSAPSGKPRKSLSKYQRNFFKSGTNNFKIVRKHKRLQ